MRVYFADPPIEWAVAIFTYELQGQQNEIHRVVMGRFNVICHGPSMRSLHPVLREDVSG